MENNNQQGQINIELDEQTAEGTYSNLAIINHSNSEFVVDFVTIMPGVPKAKVKSRIILTPQHAKRLLKALGENIQRFDKFLFISFPCYRCRREISPFIIGAKFT